MSSKMNASGSLKTVTASSKLRPCFRILLAHVLRMVQRAHTRGGKAHAQRYGRGHYLDQLWDGESQCCHGHGSAECGETPGLPAAREMRRTQEKEQSRRPDPADRGDPRRGDIKRLF